MRLRLAFGLGIGVCAIAAMAQTVTQSLALMGLAEESARRSSIQSEWVRRAARLSGEPIRQEFPDGSIIEWVGFDRAGWPFYVQTNNRVAAISVNTLPCWPGQTSGLSLDGTGVRLGIWDGGAVLASHQEFQGRVTLGNSGSSASHASHVAGTMIAGGVSASAIGMSPKATLRSYNWSNDTGEMASEAAGGLLLSNHSYGRVTGWNFSNNTWYWYGNPAVSEAEDVAFGLYDEAARVWDTVAYNAPRYLIVKSAGNDRNDRPTSQPTQHLVRVNGTWTESATVRDPDGGNDGYDSMSSYSLAKNILSVGAINDVPNGYSSPSSVVMTAFSGWGPADDGRIKPDIVANGTALNSVSNASTTSYASSSGTSMAAPNVTGSLGLLVEQARRTLGRDLMAATMKGLAIHTTDETGDTPGPDYRFGWGLLNTRRAAETIRQHGAMHPTLFEQVLPNGGKFAVPVVSDGSGPLRATICWTDPTGSLPPYTLNPRNKVLVHDLDLRLVGPDGTHLPWTLNVFNPTAAAVPGDNSTDNVEQVLLNNPTAGVYWVEVTHKGSLALPNQAFSLVVTGHLPNRTVSGRVGWSGWSGPSIAETEVAYYAPGQVTPFWSGPVSLSASGEFTLSAPPMATRFVLHRRPWLRFAAQVDSPEAVSGLLWTLVNGDVNGDNSVNAMDFLALRAAFGSSTGDAAWNPFADLNGDGSVGIADFQILRANFGRSGDL